MMDNIHKWDPLDPFLSDNNDNNSSKMTALIILNQPLTKDNSKYFIRLWNRSCLRICVDGGTNQLYEWSLRHNKLDEMIPDYICGDLDSLRANVRDYYIEKGSKCVRLSNQDLNDFSKTLKFIVNCIKSGQLDSDLIDDQIDENESSKIFTLNQKFLNQIENIKIERIYCICEFGGRLDHSLANLNSLFDSSLSNINTYLMGCESIAFLLRKGANIIYINRENEVCGKYCGLIPIGMPAYVTTRGLKWNLNNQLTQFGSLVSSSNEFDIDENNLSYSNKRHVFVETDQPILWTMSILN
jgi:thiamine pyrophosphokinase